MKIKLALLDNDTQYLNRLVTVFNDKYADKLETYSFTGLSYALKAVADAKINILAADESFDIDLEELPKSCGLAYLTGDTVIETVKDKPAICKYQKADELYRQILDVFAESADRNYVFKAGSGNTSLILFSSPAGGTGTSTLAAAAAAHYAQKGLRVLYLNYECFGGANTYFPASGKDFGDIIYALKSKKNNLPLKLESCLTQDASTGVCFYPQSKLALDMLELAAEEKLRLTEELLCSDLFDKIILDADFSLQPDFLSLARFADKWVWCTDGSASANAKTSRAYNALQILEQAEEGDLEQKVLLFGNKWGVDSVLPFGDALQMAGKVAFTAGKDAAIRVRALAELPVFDAI